MADPVVHLFTGEKNDDGTITVSSAITVCCRAFAPLGDRGTIDPDAVTCSVSANSGEAGR